jgi:hypothetical protein
MQNLRVNKFDSMATEFMKDTGNLTQQSIQRKAKDIFIEY